MLTGRNRFEVRARAEVATRAGQDGNERLVIGVETPKRIRKRLRGLPVHRVPNLRAVDCDDRDLIVKLVANGHEEVVVSVRSRGKLEFSTLLNLGSIGCRLVVFPFA